MRATGGLADTVVDASEPEGNGFVFEGARPAELMAALRRAERMLADPAAWAALQQAGMKLEFSWDLAASGYEEMYRLALGGE